MEQDNFNLGTIVQGAKKVASSNVGKAVSTKVGTDLKSKYLGGSSSSVGTTVDTSLPFYPTKAEMLTASEKGGWERVEPAAIQASYNPDTGRWQRGDWNFQVISTNPIQVRTSKGNESGILKSSINAKVPTSVHPQNATLLAANQPKKDTMSYTSGRIKQSSTSSTPRQNEPSLGQITTADQGKAIADTSAETKTYVIYGALALLVVLILIVVLKR